MSRTFTVKKDFYCEEEIFKKSKMTINPGLTVLVGCNGMGKTTLMLAMRDILRSENIPFINYNDRMNGGHNSIEAAMHKGDNNLFARLALSSEGEQIAENIVQLAKKIGEFVRDNYKSKELWIFLDAVDSGFSIDNIIDLKESLFRLILKDTSNKDVYIICSANSYEMAAGENCFDVYNGKYINFKDYEDYKAFILKTKEFKNKRYN